MPRKRSPESQNERQRIQFAFNTDVDSPVGVTFQYLLKNEHARSREGKHRGVDAMMAFWKSFAYQDQGNLSEEELQAIARESITALSRQIEAIQSAFGLEDSEFASPVNSLRQEIQQAVREAIQELLLKAGVRSLLPIDGSTNSIENSIESTIETFSGQDSVEDSVEEKEGVAFDEEAVLGTLSDFGSLVA